MNPIKALITRLITSDFFQTMQRGFYRYKRIIFRQQAVVRYFHQVEDPYSYLTAATLNNLQIKYNITLECYLMHPPTDAAVPERALLRAYAFRDCQRLSSAYNIEFRFFNEKLNAEDVITANRILANTLQKKTNTAFIEAAFLVSRALWTQDKSSFDTLLKKYGSASDTVVEKTLAHGVKTQHDYGHYINATFQFDGEWYWGIDRLYYLEQRLQAEGLSNNKEDRSLLRPPKMLFFHNMTTPFLENKPQIEYWFSFRSPYSWIALPRIRQLAKHYGATLQLRFIIPMVMRGLPVNYAKAKYIILDTKREANKFNLPFGNIHDPKGVSILRANAVLFYAIKCGLGEEFAESVFKAIFAEGVDLSTDKALLRVAKRAELDEKMVFEALQDESWREVAEENRKALYAMGLWGAPSFRVTGKEAYWGQDRIYLLEEDLLEVVGKKRIQFDVKNRVG